MKFTTALATLTLSGLAFAASTAPALANLAACEVVITERVEDEYGGGIEIASYRPAGAFMASVYGDASEPLYKIGEHAIKGVLCKRNDIVPTDLDYAIVATGIPLVLSQDFDSADSDSLTVYFKDGAFQDLHKGPIMSQETRAQLDARLADFTARDHGLDVKEAAKATSTEIMTNDAAVTEPTDEDVMPTDAPLYDETMNGAVIIDGEVMENDGLTDDSNEIGVEGLDDGLTDAEAPENAERLSIEESKSFR